MADDQLDEMVGRVRDSINGAGWRYKITNCYTADLEALLAAYESVREERDKMLDAINWACGLRGEFERPADAGQYWWRSELTSRAELEYNSREVSYERRTGGTE